jgi:hypothetical protein
MYPHALTSVLTRLGVKAIPLCHLLTSVFFTRKTEGGRSWGWWCQEGALFFFCVGVQGRVCRHLRVFAASSYDSRQPSAPSLCGLKLLCCPSEEAGERPFIGHASQFQPVTALTEDGAHRPSFPRSKYRIPVFGLIPGNLRINHSPASTSHTSPSPMSPYQFLSWHAIQLSCF